MLENLFIKGTSKTPEVNFRNDGKMEIYGVSVSDDSIEFYKPLLSWIEKYSKNPANSTELNLKFDYFDVSSSKCILDIFKNVELIHKNKGGVVVNWHCDEDDEDMIEAGEDYESAIRIPFRFLNIRKN